MTRFANDGQEVWADLNANNTLQTRYLRGDVVDQIFARESAAGTAAWYLMDHLGSVRDLTDGSGVKQDHIDYDAFGNIKQETNPAFGDRYKYTGQQYQAQTGEYYYKDRIYNPATGQFESQDKEVFGAGDPSNPYRYVGNGPTNTTDPSGLEGQPQQDRSNGPDIFGMLDQLKKKGLLDNLPRAPKKGMPFDLAARFKEYNPPSKIDAAPQRPPGVPIQLKGIWEVSVRVNTDGVGHAWIFYKKVGDPTQIHSASRIKHGYGRPVDENGNTIPNTQGVGYSGVQWDIDKDRIKQFTERYPVIVEDPIIYADFGYDERNNNCVTYAKDAWENTTGEDLEIGWYFWDSTASLEGAIVDANRNDSTPPANFETTVWKAIGFGFGGIPP